MAALQGCRTLVAPAKQLALPPAVWLRPEVANSSQTHRQSSTATAGRAEGGLGMLPRLVAQVGERVKCRQKEGGTNEGGNGLDMLERKALERVLLPCPRGKGPWCQVFPSTFLPGHFIPFVYGGPGEGLPPLLLPLPGR